MNGGCGNPRLYRVEGVGGLATILLVSIVCIGLGAPPAAAASCGAPGQRACCNGLLEYSNVGTACNCGAVIASGCSGDCQCGGAIVADTGCKRVGRAPPRGRAGP